MTDEEQIEDADSEPEDDLERTTMPHWKKEYLRACKQFGIQPDMTGSSGEVLRIGEKRVVRR